MLEQGLPRLRRRLETGYRAGEFPVLDELQGEGATDYIASGHVAKQVGDAEFGNDVKGLSEREPESQA